MKLLTLFLISEFLFNYGFGQKKPLDIAVAQNWPTISKPVFDSKNLSIAYQLNDSTILLWHTSQKITHTFFIPNYKCHLSFHFGDSGNHLVFQSLILQSKAQPRKSDHVDVDIWNWQDSILKSAKLYQLSTPDSLIVRAYVDVRTKSIVKSDTVQWSWSGWQYKAPAVPLKPKHSRRLGNKYPETDSITIIGQLNNKQFILARKTLSEPTNLILTNQFKTFMPLTNINPHKEYNWYTAEEIQFINDKIQSIVYKPEDFDSTKKYPVIISLKDSRIIGQKSNDTIYTPWLYNGNITSRSGTGLYSPVLSNGILNTAYFASNGYIVLEMVSTIETGRPGPAMFDRVMNAVNYLRQFNWIDTAHLGIQGQGTSGYFVNYIITQTSIFKAAQESSGQTDLISHYGSINGKGESIQPYYDAINGFFGKTLWQDSASYIWQSPVILANKIQTPLLMMHNKEDLITPFAQSIELFTGMRRLGNRCWLLQYENEQHTLTDPINQEDFTTRLKQFYDHYLKETGAPIWMTRGVAAKDRGTITGREIDTEIKTPPIGGLLRSAQKKGNEN